MPLWLLSHEKKCQPQLFRSSVVELLQERFSNIFSAPLQEACCAGGRRGGHGRPWLRKCWLDPAGSRSCCPHCHCHHRWVHPNPFLRAATALSLWSLPICYLLPVSKQNPLHFCGSALAQCPPPSPPLPSISMSFPPHWELCLEMSQSNPCVSTTRSPLFGWKKKTTYPAYSGFSLFLVRVLTIKYLNTHWIAGWNASLFSPQWGPYLPEPFF